MNYYDYQIKRLGTDLVTADIKIQNEHGETHWMTISPEQVAAILEILKQSEEV